MFKTFQIITILASTAIGTYAMDEQDSFYTCHVNTLSQDHDFEVYDAPTTACSELAGYSFEKVELQESIEEEQKERTPKLRKKQKKLIPARFTSPNSKTKSYQERATRYEKRSKNKENIHYENGCPLFDTIKISQKPLATPKPQAPARVLQPVEVAPTPQPEFKLPEFYWSHMPRSYQPVFDLAELNYPSLNDLPEWDEIAENF